MVIIGQRSSQMSSPSIIFGLNPFPRPPKTGYFYYKLPPKFSEWKVRTIRRLRWLAQIKWWVSHELHEWTRKLIIAAKSRKSRKDKLATPVRSSGPTGQADTHRHTGRKKDEKRSLAQSRPSTIFRSYGVDKRRKNSLSQSPREHGGWFG